MEHLRNDALQTRDPPRLRMRPQALSLEYLDRCLSFGGRNFRGAANVAILGNGPGLSGLNFGNITFLLSRKPKRSSREGYPGSLLLSLLHGNKDFGAKRSTVKVPARRSAKSEAPAGTAAFGPLDFVSCFELAVGSCCS